MKSKKQTKVETEDLDLLEAEEECCHMDMIPRWQCAKCKVLFRKEKGEYFELGKEEILPDNGEEERNKNCL